MRRHITRWAVLEVALAAIVSACAGSSPTPSAATDSLDGPELVSALDSIHGQPDQAAHERAGRRSARGERPGERGYDEALAYVETTLKSYGLQPAGQQGGFHQRVPLRNSIVTEDASSMTVRSGAKTKTLTYGKDYLLGADLLRSEVSIADAPVVFVGYGVSAPTLGYDDYAAGVDVKGKVVAYLSGAPAMLPSNERAYYSSGAVKEADAAKRGAIGTISFTSPDDPRFRWDVSVATSKQGSFAWMDAQGNPNRGDASLRGSASLNHSGVEALFAGAPQAPAAVFAAAAKSTPQAFDLATRVSLVTHSTHRDVESANLVARLEGSDPVLKDEHVVYIAHVDHFGRGVAMNGGRHLQRGARQRLQVSPSCSRSRTRYSTLKTRPRRSVLFLFVTAEERGLLGSDYFARNPTVPRGGIVADLALDMPFLFHPLLDIVPYRAQHSTLVAPVTRAAQHLGIAIAADPIPEQVLFIRSDHFSFVRQGVPSLFIKSGSRPGIRLGMAAKINAAYRRDVYHKPNDDMSQAFDFDAGAQHARLNFLTGWLVAEESARPAWNAGDFFGGLFGREPKDTNSRDHPIFRFSATSEGAMRPLGFAIVLAVCSSPFLSSAPKLTGGTGTIFVGSYAKRMVVIDEATERVTAEIPLVTGIPWSARRSQDGTRFYIQNADQEHFEVVDIATRKSIDSFTLSEGNRKVRALAFAVDPQHRIMTLVTRTTTKLIDRFEIGAPTFIQYDLRDHKVVRTLPWSTDPEPAYFSPDAILTGRQAAVCVFR